MLSVVCVITSYRLKIESLSSHIHRIGNCFEPIFYVSLSTTQNSQVTLTKASIYFASYLHLFICFFLILKNLEALLFLRRCCTICQWNWLWLIFFYIENWTSVDLQWWKITWRLKWRTHWTMEMHYIRSKEYLKNWRRMQMVMSRRPNQNASNAIVFVAHLYLLLSSISNAFDFCIVQNSTVRWFHWPSLNCLAFIVKRGHWLPSHALFA